MGVIVLAIVLADLVWTGLGNNHTLQLVREIPTKLHPERLERNISSLTRWPQWFYSLTEAKMVSPHSELKKGSLIRFQMDPKKGEKKKFILFAEVEEYQPGQILKLKITDDSSGRLTRIFDQIEWTIQFHSTPKGTVIRGIATARTKHWRSRLFGQIAEKILMNQIFYPNLLKLSELRWPFSVEVPQVPQTGF